MDHNTWKIIHLVGIAALSLGVGGMMADGKNRRLFAIWQGVGLLIMLVSGFGLLAKLQLGFPHFAMVKTLLWLLIGAMPVLLRRLKVPVFVGILVSLTLVCLMAWLGVTKPALW
jgi:hypothetical protein